MKNKALKVFAGFIIVLVTIFIVLGFAVDGLVKSSIEENGTDLFQTEVEVDNVNISLLNGSGEINGFRVLNPEDFSNQSAIEMDEIHIKVDLMSFLSDTIWVENVYISGARLFFEQQGFGINLRQLNQNMEQTAGEGETAMVINTLILENATVRVSSSIERERTAEATIESFELSDIGRQGNNTIQQNMREIMKPLIERAIREAMTGGLLEQLQNKVQDLFNGNEK